MSRSFIKLQDRMIQAVEGRRESGVTAIEYSIMAALIVAVLVVAYAALATQIGTLFGNIGGNLHL